MWEKNKTKRLYGESIMSCRSSFITGDKGISLLKVIALILNGTHFLFFFNMIDNVNCTLIRLSNIPSLLHY